MILESLHVRNFRCLSDTSIGFGKLTVLVGPNGSGKSSILQAMRLLWNSKATILSGDFFGGCFDEPIEVEATFSDLDAEIQSAFSHYAIEGKLMVRRRVQCLAGQMSSKTECMRLENPDFSAVRSAADSEAKKGVYSVLQKIPKYGCLPSWTSWKAIDQAMSDWELDHQGECVPGWDGGALIGSRGLDQSDFARYWRLEYVPAVSDPAAEGEERRGSMLETVVNGEARRAMLSNPAFVELQRTIQSRYRDEVLTGGAPELDGLSSRLTMNVRRFIPSASVEVHWSRTPPPDLMPPAAEVALLEDGYSTSVARVGSGLQRVFYIGMTDEAHRPAGAPQTDVAGETSAGNQDASSVMLAIEEPEIYQHPDRQRHLRKTLEGMVSELANDGQGGIRQIAYTTHSALMVNIEQFENVRLVTKVCNAGVPGSTMTTSADTQAILDRIAALPEGRGGEITADGFRVRLHAVDNPLVNEGFFARLVVLVEGEDDRAAILGLAQTRGLDLEAEGCSVIPCGGKTNLEKPCLIFDSLGLPTYVVWDMDYSENYEHLDSLTGQARKRATKELGHNRRLLQLVGSDVAAEDWLPLTTERFACFRTNLEKTMQQELGREVFDERIGAAISRYGIRDRESALKIPAVLVDVLRAAVSAGATCATLDGILERIEALLQRGPSENE